MSCEESAGEEVGRERNEDVAMDVTLYGVSKMDRIRNCIIRGTTKKVGKISNKVEGIGIARRPMVNVVEKERKTEAEVNGQCKCGLEERQTMHRSEATVMQLSTSA